jgi:hypothetical protein
MRKQNKSPGSLHNLNASVSMLYSDAAPEDLLTPDLNDGGNDSDPEDVVEDSGDISFDGAELVKDELADIEGLIEAAKGVSVSS